MDQALLNLIAQGKITYEDVLIAGGISPEVKRLTNIMHTMWCPFNHDTECGWFAEEQVYVDVQDSDTSDKWARPAHRQWVDLAYKFTEYLCCNPNTVLDIYFDISATIKQWKSRHITMCKMLIDPTCFEQVLSVSLTAAAGPELESVSEPSQSFDELDEFVSHHSDAENQES